MNHNSRTIDGIVFLLYTEKAKIQPHLVFAEKTGTRTKPNIHVVTRIAPDMLNPLEYTVLTLSSGDTIQYPISYEFLRNIYVSEPGTKTIKKSKFEDNGNEE